MHLPDEIRDYIAEYTEGVDLASLRRAAAAVSHGYRAGVATRELPVAARERAAAYLVTRFPATYAAAMCAFRETARRLPGVGIESVCDLGAGPGATSRAAIAVWPEIARFALLEQDQTLSAIARALVPGADIERKDIRGWDGGGAFDLVVAGYSLGELAEEEAAALALRAFETARVAFVLIEPGTPASFARLLRLRALLAESGAKIAAPCPGNTPCPLREPDWCHFGARLERSALHRRLKEGTQSYEDEKFSYLAVTRNPVSPGAGRILRRPSHAPGLVTLEVCREGRADRVRAAKRHRDEFRAARKAEWGGIWPPATPGS